MQYEEQVGYLNKAKEYVEGEVEEVRWAMERGKEQYEEVVGKLKEATD